MKSLGENVRWKKEGKAAEGTERMQLHAFMRRYETCPITNHLLMPACTGCIIRCAALLQHVTTV